MGAIIILPLLLSVFYLACIWIIFAKAGKPGWACIVPIYNIIVFIQIVKKPVWWILLFLIPIVNIVIGIILTHRLSRSFGHDVGFTLGLLFLSFIFLPILAFSGNTYKELED